VHSERLLPILFKNIGSVRNAISIPNAVDVRNVESLESHRYGEIDRVITIANLKPVKGLEYLLRAVRMVIDEGYSVHLDVVGDGSLLGSLKGLSASLGINDRVRFLGQVHPDNVIRVLLDGGIFAVSSLAEGLPSSLLEAMVVGLPAVCTAVGGIPELITDGENGLLVPPKDSSALAKAIARMLQDRAYAQKLGRSGRISVLKRHRVETVALKHYYLFLSLLRSQV